ncbi:GNAT family N-acetyltransferase [Lichenicoccus sp.]|uniref:GNAT family N-acetyltransferase n=1 Tax=Lichenicoccus sp. TaxID=2781899 RepID=UPI003D0BD7B5
MSVTTPIAAASLPTHQRAHGFGELRAGNLGVRIATTGAERDAAQALRYRIFYEEMGAEPDTRARRTRRDVDAFDAVADHLLVIDHAVSSGPRGVVGTYRLVQNEGAKQIGRFYTSDEYDISRITGFPGRLLELGRSCIDAAYRSRAAMQLLWRGVAAYVFLHRIDVMFGCASLPGTDPDLLARELTFLYHNHLAPPALRLRAVPGRYIDMRRCDPAEIDHKRVQQQLPPLIKGYLRLGGFIGDGAVVDRQFNTTDVAVVVKTDLITDKYYRHYERQLRDALD